MCTDASIILTVYDCFQKVATTTGSDTQPKVVLKLSMIIICDTLLKLFIISNMCYVVNFSGCVIDVLWDARSKWRNIGIAVELKPSALASIASENPNSDGDKLTAVLTEWFKQIDPEPSWEQLVKALRSPAVDFPDIARKIEQDQEISSE